MNFTNFKATNTNTNQPTHPYDTSSDTFRLPNIFRDQIDKFLPNDWIYHDRHDNKSQTNCKENDDVHHFVKGAW